jgi:hypothetical protein
MAEASLNLDLQFYGLQEAALLQQWMAGRFGQDRVRLIILSYEHQYRMVYRGVDHPTGVNLCLYLQQQHYCFIGRPEQLFNVRLSFVCHILYIKIFFFLNYTYRRTNTVLTAAVALSNVVPIQSIVDSAVGNAFGMVREDPALARTTEFALIVALSSRRRTALARTNWSAGQAHHPEYSVTAVEMDAAFALYAAYIVYFKIIYICVCYISHDSFVRNAIE